jgi:DNA-binding IclR family transcriptional regulator
LTSSAEFILCHAVSRYKTAPSPYKVQVLDRALALLDVLAQEPGGSSLGDLCLPLQLHKSTVHRLLMVLERHRLVVKNAETGRYRLGLKLFELGSKAIGMLDLQEHVRPHLQRLQQETQETVNLAILDQGDVLYLAKIEPQRHLRMASSVGLRYPAHSTALGKAILAALPEPEVEAILLHAKLSARTRTTITSMAALREELRVTRNRGYAIDDEENEEGACCVGAVVRDHLGGPIAAISVSGPAMRVTRNKVPELAQIVVGIARTISAELGFKAEEVQEANATA